VEFLSATRWVGGLGWGGMIVLVSE